MSYTPNNTFGNIPLTGVLVPGITEGFIADSKYIKGGYIVVKTIEDRDALLDKSIYEDKEIVVGTPVFVSDENKTYRYAGVVDGVESWQEDTSDTQEITENIQTLQEDTAKIKEQIVADKEATDASINAVNESIANAVANATEKFTQVDSAIDELDSRVDQTVTGETFFAALTNVQAELDKKADATELEKIIWDSDAATDYEVGGLCAGSFLKGKNLKEILMMILYGYQLIKPEHTEPSVSVEVSPIIGVANTPVTISGTITFNRGDITLNGQHQGYYFGNITGFKVGDGVIQPVTVGEGSLIEKVNFNYTYENILEGDQEVKLTVFYNAGDPQKDSFGYVIADGQPAGSMETSFKMTGLTNTYTGNSDSDLSDVTLNNIVLGDIITDNSVDAITEQGMFEERDDESGELIGAGYQLTVPKTKYNEDYTQSYHPIVLFPSDIQLVGIKSWSGLHNAWEWYNGETAEESLAAGTFVKTNRTVVKEINTARIEYTVYECTEDFIGEKYFRFFVA